MGGWVSFSVKRNEGSLVVLVFSVSLSSFISLVPRGKLQLCGCLRARSTLGNTGEFAVY